MVASARLLGESLRRRSAALFPYEPVNVFETLYGRERSQETRVDKSIRGHLAVIYGVSTFARTDRNSVCESVAKFSLAALGKNS